MARTASGNAPTEDQARVALVGAIREYLRAFAPDLYRACDYVSLACWAYGCGEDVVSFDGPMSNPDRARNYFWTPGDDEDDAHEPVVVDDG